MLLRDWIIKTGPTKVAKLLKVRPQTVSQWRLTDALPKPTTMVKIYKLTKGRVSYKNMVEHFANSNK